MPRPFVSIALLASGIILAALPGAAQQYGYPRNQPNQRYENDRPLDRVQQDLDRAAEQPYLDPNARGKLEHARQKIWEFQRKWAAGRFDAGKLNDAIGSIQHAINHRSMNYANRRALADDMARIADVRAARVIGGPAYGYR